MRYVFILLLLLSGSMIQAQTDSIRVWNKWCSKADTALLFPTGNNVIQIYCKGMEATSLVVKSLDNALKTGTPEYRGDTISIMAMPYPKYGKRMRLTISQKGSRKVLKTVNFSAENAPVPIARLGTLTIDKPTKKEILAQNALRVGFQNSLYSYPYRIKQYTFRARVGGKEIVIPVKGFLITNEVTNILSIAAVGTFVEFTDIKAACMDCEPRVLPDLKMWIK